MLGTDHLSRRRADRRRRFISGLLAMYRGFAREMLSIVSWVIAAGAVLYFVIYHKPVAEDLAQQMGTQVAVAQIAVGAVIFLIVLIVVHLITARISDAILDSRIGMIDRVLGLHFRRAARLHPDRHPLHVLRGVLPRSGTRISRGCAKQSRCPISRRPGDTLRSVLESHLPSSLTAPPGEQPARAAGGATGPLKKAGGDELALEAPAKHHICVTCRARGRCDRRARASVNG